MNDIVKDVPHITQQLAEAVMKVARIEYSDVLRLENEYWRHHYHGEEYRPWWGFITKHGIVVIGHRKRVFEVDWSRTPVRGKLTEEANVTSTDSYVHAWSYLKLVTYLTALHDNIVKYEKELAQKEAP